MIPLQPLLEQLSLSKVFALRAVFNQFDPGLSNTVDEQAEERDENVGAHCEYWYVSRLEVGLNITKYVKDEKAVYYV